MKTAQQHKYGRATSRARGYNKKWEKARADFLRCHPLCKYCKALGKITAAAVVDHIKPHKGDDRLFWDQSNWQPLCKHCHDSAKQSEERNGMLRGAAEDGTPLAVNHHWNSTP